MKRIIGSTLTTLAFVAGALAMTGTTAHAADCSTVDGYAKRTTSSGIEYYQDANCGPVRLYDQPSAPNTSTATGCRAYPEGELCGVGIGAPRPTIAFPAFVRLYASPGGSTAIGHVTVGDVEDITPKEDSK